MKVYLTHTADALANYYGERALAALRQVAEVRLNETGRHLAGAELAEAAAGCDAIVSYRQSPGEAATFRHRPTWSPSCAAPSISATSTWRRPVPPACW